MTKAISKQFPSLPIAVGLCLIFLSSAFLSTHATAAQYYRYKDENGNVVLNRTIPPRFVGKGYEILNDRGRVIETVPPALTPEQIAARDAERERQRQLEEQRLEQERIDEELKQLYSHPDDAVRVLKRRIQDIEGVIQLKESKIESAEREIIKQEGIAANIQRNGRAIPENIIATIKSLKNDIVNARADIKELQAERTKVLAEFDEKIRRLEIITDKQASEYRDWLQQLNKPASQSNPPATSQAASDNASNANTP